MELTEQDLLDKTHYGLGIYAFILRKYYEGETVLHLAGRLCKPAKNPFRNDSLTLIVEEMEGRFYFRDSADENLKGDPFDFAARHFNLHGQELLQRLNQEMHLRIGENPWRRDSGLNITVVEEEPKPKPILPRFSYFKAPITNTMPAKEVTIIDVYHHIKYDFREQTAELRAIRDKKAARQFKANNFDYVTFSGIFRKRSDSDLVKHSGLLAIDFDHVDDMATLWQRLLADEYFDTEILFTSPSGDGLKWIICIDITEHSHRDWFTSIKHYIRETYGQDVDSAGKDISRACFLPHDSNIFFHPKYHS